MHNNKFSHSVIWNRFILFEKIMDSEGWGIPCMIAFDKPIDVNDDYLASISASKKKNMDSLERCPFCGAHKLSRLIFAEGRKCKSCGKNIV